ncbi:MAG: GGDEF domain-containing protein [Rhodospirillales bacterium]|nr:GGDEF domain-containing protein [Rhodospirillales bacterium]
MSLKDELAKKQALKEFRRRNGLGLGKGDLTPDEITKLQEDGNKAQGEKTLIQQLEQANQRASVDRNTSIRDSLTGLYNRRYFDDALPKTLTKLRRSGGRIALIMVDIDHFKKFNDTYGHQVGDAVLKKTAERLQKAVRADDIVARYGGEEMIVIMEVNNGNDVDPALARLESEMCAFTIEHKGKEYKIGSSIGIGISGPAITPENIINAADKALYKVKQTTRGHMEIYDLSVFDGRQTLDVKPNPPE